MVNRKLKGKIVEHFGTQSDFSSAIGQDETLVSRVIRGRRQLSIEEQRKWARVLKTKVVEIFGD